MATQYQLAKGIRQYKATIAKLSLTVTMNEELKKLILAAVDQLFLASLDDDTFGFAQVSVTNMLTHLQTTYGTITCADLEANCASIATLWSLANPIKLLWECLCEVQYIATVGNDPFTNQAIIDLTFLLLKSTGVFTLSCDMWFIHLAANKTLTEFHIFFTTENKECLHKLTTGQGGFHRANAATILGNKLAPPPHSKAAVPARPLSPRLPP